ncbi:IS21-like element helper ATPase IstB [Quatrionicoccus australiensis]|uniref:IS21-like element helper ATPase IstB n=1 Tax=Quatrionicoccus australiensis TaxID=138118 RepID=UPI001CF8740C|nr:IS21-like element helper ATPase IstB [Quatrionicoccus australiensis]UCV16650.1 IS21-like element helper ATPase IstB [Quatrionicoccus australiensis]
MMIQDTLHKLNEMKLFGMAKGFEDQLASTLAGPLSFEERFGLLVDQESTCRENRKLQRLLLLAKLRESACVEDIDFRPGRGLDRAEIASLALGNWIRHGHNLITTGPTGSGKTWLACAFGNQACRQGMSVSFLRLPLLLEDLAVSHGDGSFRKRLMQLAKVDLLVLDDFGMAALNAVGRNDLLEVIECRNGTRSTLITSQLPVDRWHDYLSGGNPTVADAILDRLVSGSHRLELKGESMRKQRARKSATT